MTHNRRTYSSRDLRRPQPTPRRRGFTLLELLVALMMGAALIAGISAALGVAFKARESAESAVEPGRTFELANEMLKADFETAIPPNTSTTATSAAAGGASASGASASGASGGISTGSSNSSSSSGSGSTTATNYSMLAEDFEGLQNDIQFYSLADSPSHVDGNGEIKQVEFALEADPTNGSRQMLVRRVWRNITPLAQNPLPPDEEVICRGVVDFELQYFDGTDWQQTWDSTQFNNTLPAAVQVTLVLERPTPNGRTRQIRNTSVFSLPCSTTLPGSTNGSGGTGSNGLFGS